MKWQTNDVKRYWLNPNCFEKTKRSVGHFFFFSSTNVETKNVRPIAYNVGRIGEEADAQMFIGIQMFKIITNA